MKKIALAILVFLGSMVLIGCERVNAQLELNKGSITLAVGGSETLVVTIKDGSEEEITWSSDDTNIVTVDQDGKVLAIKEGVTKVRATIQNGSYVACTVTVSDSLAELKKNAIKEIDNLYNSLNKDDYSKENWFMIQSYVSIAKSAIETLTSEEEITEIKNDALAAIRNTPTNELKKAKDDAIAAIKAHVESLTKDDYSETDWLRINLYELEAFIKINDAKNGADITSIKEATITSINAVPKTV